MMKAKILPVLVVACAFGAVDSYALEPPNAKDLTQGNWELNVAKSKFCNPAPKKGGRRIFDAGWGLIVFEQSGVSAEGKETNGRYVGRYDGDKYPDIATGPAKEAITWKLVDPHRVEFTHWSKEDKMTSAYVRTVSADGQTMTQHAKFVGRPCEEDQVFERR